MTFKNEPTQPSWHTDEYDRFRTGLTYYEIWQVLRQEKEIGKRRHITRHTVLGKWHEIKLSMFHACYEAHAETPGTEDLEAVPF